MHLIEEAIFPGIDAVSVLPSGDLRGDLNRFVTAYRAAFSQPAAMAALPLLVASYQSGADSRGPDERAWRTVRPQFRAILAAAAEGEVDPSIDPDEFCDLLLGAVLFRIHTASLGVRTEARDHTVELLCRAMRPPGRS
jgi:AcrR family transcriptional regulator